MEVDEGSDQNSDIQPHWMAAHVRFKNEFTEDEWYYNLMTWLKCSYVQGNRNRMTPAQTHSNNFEFIVFEIKCKCFIVALNWKYFVNVTLMSHSILQTACTLPLTAS